MKPLLRELRQVILREGRLKITPMNDLFYKAAPLLR